MLSRFFARNPSDEEIEPILFALMRRIEEDEDLLLPRSIVGRLGGDEIAERIGVTPMIYAWNEDYVRKTFSLSVNGKAIAHVLEGIIPRTDPRFAPARAAASARIAAQARAAAAKSCVATGLMPSQVFPLEYLL